MINTTWWGVRVPSDVHQNGICFSSPFNRWEECETNWAKLQGHLLINQAEKRGEHIRGQGLDMWGQRHGVLIGEINRYLGIIGWAHKSWRGMKYLKVPWQQHPLIHRKLNKNWLASILNARWSHTGKHSCGWQDFSPLECYLPFPILSMYTTFSI